MNQHNGTDDALKVTTAPSAITPTTKSPRTMNCLKEFGQNEPHEAYHQDARMTSIPYKAHNPSGSDCDCKYHNDNKENEENSIFETPTALIDNLALKSLLKARTSYPFINQLDPSPPINNCRL